MLLADMGERCSRLNDPELETALARWSNYGLRDHGSKFHNIYMNKMGKETLLCEKK